MFWLIFYTLYVLEKYIGATDIQCVCLNNKFSDLTSHQVRTPFYKSSTTKLHIHSMLEASDHLLQMKHATKALTFKNGYGRYFMLSHYAVIFIVAYRQKVGELQDRSRI